MENEEGGKEGGVRMARKPVVRLSVVGEFIVGAGSGGKIFRQN